MDFFEISSSGSSQALAVLELRARAAESVHDRLEAASDFIYEQTRQRFDEQGEGEWPELTEATVAKKASQGYSDPARILYADGNLYESATSPNGPYSLRVFVDEPGHHSVSMIVDWESDGWQLASVLAEGSERGLPARPIWPPSDRVQSDVARILLGGMARADALARLGF
jgi:hypothetical protein